MRKPIFLLLLTAFSICLSAQTDIVKKGDKMPFFELESHANGNISSSQLDNKVTLIVIFATWCPPCQQELGALQQAIDKQKIRFGKENPDLAILVVGREHNEEELIAYKEKKGFTFPIYPDPNREFTAKFATQSIPRAYLFDKNGKIVYTSVGYDEKEFQQLVNTIDKLLK